MSESWCTDVEQGAVLLSVNQRLSRHYVHLHSQAQLAAERLWWETPEILPLTAWLRTVHATCVANGSSTKSLLPDIAAERAWQQAVASDDASSVLLDTDLAAANAQKAWQVSNAWYCAGSAEGDGSASEDQLAYSRWRNTYVKYCRKKQLVDAATLVDHVIELLTLTPTPVELPKKILLAGFIVVPAQLQRLMAVLTDNGVAIEHIEPMKKARSMRVVHLDDDASFTAIAEQTRSVLKQNPAQSLGVVVHNLQQKRAQVLRAFDNAFFPALNPDEINVIERPYDLSIGLPLNEQSVVRTALLLLNLLTKGVNDTELSGLLLSPYLPGSNKDRRARELLDRQCRNRRVRQVSFFEFIKLLPKVDPLREPLQKMSKLKWKNKNAAAIWAEHFGHALGQLGWPGKSLNSEEYQTVEAWNTCLDDVQVLDDGEPLTQQRALRLLLNLCRSRLFQMQTAATPIQIMGRLESHGLSFDKLWVTGLDAEQWPPVSTPTSFIPIQQQQAAGVPDASPAQRLVIATQEMALWTKSADELFLCHAQDRDGIELSPASIIADIEAVTPSIGAVTSSQTAVVIQASAQIESIDDTNGPALPDGALVKGGTRLLEDQARCPFKAFALHRLRIKKLEEAGIGLDPRQHGTLFHVAMEYFWKELKTHENLLALSEEELEVLIKSVIEQSMADNEIEANLQDLQSRYLFKLIFNWVNRVEQYRKPFEVVGLELEQKIDIANFTINVTVDRIDKLDTGQTIVIDYKTGQHNAIKTWGEPRIENPQLPLYAGTDEKVEGVCFAQVFPNQNKFIGTTSEDGLVGTLQAPENHRSLSKSLQSWQHAKEHWANSLNMLGTEVSEGLASITPLPKACDFCDLPALCRINKQTTDLDDGADADADSGAITQVRT